jgi:PPOX class probable F420-dependent enzyme
MGIDLDTALAFVRDHDGGVLVTSRADGRPQLSNIVYVTGGDGSVRVSVTDSRAKTANLRRNPRASLHVTSEDFWSYVVLEGTAALSAVAGAPDDEVVDALVEVYRSAQGEHPDWDEFRRTMVDDRRLIVKLTPERAYGALGS